MGSLGKDVARELGADDAQVAEEIRTNDEAHSAIMRRHFNLQWTDSEHHDLVLNTKRVTVEECVTEVLALVRSPQVTVNSQAGRVMLSGAGSTDEMLAFLEVASAVPGVRDVAYRTHPGEELRPRLH
jgi:hypothetical protein